MRKVLIGSFIAAIAMATPSLVFAEEANIPVEIEENIENMEENTSEEDRVTENEDIVESDTESVTEGELLTESATATENESVTNVEEKSGIVKVPYAFKYPTNIYSLPDSFVPDKSYNRNWIKNVEYTNVGEIQGMGEIELAPGFYQFSDKYRHNVLVKVEDGKYYRWDRSFSFVDPEIIEADPTYWDADSAPYINIGFKNEKGELINNISFDFIYDGQKMPIVETTYMYYADDDSLVVTNYPIYDIFAPLPYGDFLLHVNNVPDGYSIPTDRTINLSENGIEGADDFGNIFITLETKKENKKIATPVKTNEVKSASVSTVAAPTGDNTFLYGIMALGGLAGIVLGLWKTIKR